MWRIGEILIQKKLINWEQLQEGLLEQKKTREFIGEILVRQKVVPKMLLYRALAEQFGIRFVDLKKTRINPEALERVPPSLARKYMILPVDIHDNILSIGISDPLKSWPEEEIRNLSGLQEIQKILCLPEDLSGAIEECYAEKKA